MFVLNWQIFIPNNIDKLRPCHLDYWINKINWFDCLQGGQSEWHIILYISSIAAVISGAMFLFFGGGNFKRTKMETLSLAFTNEEPSSATAEQGSSRSAEGSGLPNHQAPYSKPFLIDQELMRLDSISVGVCDHPETQKLGGFETEGCLLNNSHSSLIKDRRRKMPLVSVVWRGATAAVSRSPSRVCYYTFWDCLHFS